MVSRWLEPGNRTFLEVASMIVTWWIVPFLRSVYSRGGGGCAGNFRHEEGGLNSPLDDHVMFVF